MAKALVVIDVLDGIFSLPLPLDRPREFLAAVALLLERARRAGAPVIHVQHLGPAGSRFAEGAATRRFHVDAQPRDGEPVVTKSHPDSFQDSELEAVLRETGTGEVVFAGFATEACFDSTVRSAYARGFSSEIASDAHTTTDNPVLAAPAIVAHHNFVLARFGKVLPVSEIVF